MFFHKSIQEKFELHKKQLQQFQNIPENWFWHKHNLEKLEKTLILLHDDLLALNQENPKVYALRKHVQTMLAMKYPTKEEQRPLAIETNKVLHELKDMLESESSQTEAYIEMKYVQKILDYLKLYVDEENKVQSRLKSIYYNFRKDVFPGLLQAKINIYRGENNPKLMERTAKVMSKTEVPMAKS